MKGKAIILLSQSIDCWYTTSVQGKCPQELIIFYRNWYPWQCLWKHNCLGPITAIIDYQHNTTGSGDKTNECQLDNVLLPQPIEIYQSCTPVKKVPATDNPKITCNGCCMQKHWHQSFNKILKVVFESGSMNNLIHWSALPYNYQCHQDPKMNSQGCVYFWSTKILIHRSSLPHNY